MPLYRPTVATLFIATSLLFSSFCQAEATGNTAAPTPQKPVPLAVVGETPLTLDNFKTEMNRRRGAYDLKKQEELLDSMVRSELLFAAAKSAGYENDPEVLATLKQVMAGKYLRDNLEPKLAGLKATDEEAENYYQTHQAEFSAPAMVHGALIKIAISPKASPEARRELLKRAENARTEALELGPDVPAFGTVAVTYSEDQESRYRGGDIGWVPAGSVGGRRDKKVSDALLALEKPGQISPVITAEDGYYIVKLIESKGVSVKPLASVQDEIRYHVVREKKKNIEREFMERLKGRIPVTVNRTLLQTLPQTDHAKNAGPPPLPSR